MKYLDRLKANRILKKKYLEAGITSCEAKLDGCRGSYALSWHHRLKRRYYGSDVERASDMKETVLVCCNCHALLETDRKLSDRLFEELR